MSPVSSAGLGLVTKSSLRHCIPAAYWSEPAGKAIRSPRKVASTPLLFDVASSVEPSYNAPDSASRRLNSSDCVSDHGL